MIASRRRVPKTRHTKSPIADFVVPSLRRGWGGTRLTINVAVPTTVSGYPNRNADCAFAEPMSLPGSAEMPLNQAQARRITPTIAATAKNERTTNGQRRANANVPTSPEKNAAIQRNAMYGAGLASAISLARQILL